MRAIEMFYDNRFPDRYVAVLDNGEAKLCTPSLSGLLGANIMDQLERDQRTKDSRGNPTAYPVKDYERSALINTLNDHLERIEAVEYGKKGARARWGEDRPRTKTIRVFENIADRMREEIDGDCVKWASDILEKELDCLR